MRGKELRETVGLLLVVASMVFVGLEIQQNTTVARAATRNEVAVQIVDLLMDLASDPQLADIIIRRHNGEELSEVEVLQFSQRSLAMLRYFENVHYQYRQGLYAESEFLTQREAWRGFLTKAGYDEVWCRLRETFSPEFRVDFDALLPNGC
jgi:hypothetical protein